MPRSLAQRGIATGLRSLRLDHRDPPRRVLAAVHRPGGRNAELVSALIALMEVHARDAGPGG